MLVLSRNMADVTGISTSANSLTISNQALWGVEGHPGKHTNCCTRARLLLVLPHLSLWQLAASSMRWLQSNRSGEHALLFTMSSLCSSCGGGIRGWFKRLGLRDQDPRFLLLECCSCFRRVPAPLAYYGKVSFGSSSGHALKRKPIQPHFEA